MTSNEDRARHLAADLAGEFGCVSPDTVARQATVHGVPEAALSDALKRRGVRVAPGWALPAGTPPVRLGELRQLLGQLGVRIAADVVFGDRVVRQGFALAGGFRLKTGDRRLGPQELRAARDRLRGSHDQAGEAGRRVLAILQQVAGQPGGLDDLLCWELVEILRPQVASGLTQRKAAREVASLGLRADDADALALAVVEAQMERDRTARVRDIEHALRGRRLRTAEKLAATLPPGPDTEALVGRVRQQVEQVAALLRDAEHARAAGRLETSAEHLVEAARLVADDDEPRRRLDSLPPPAPAGARLEVDGHQVMVRWQAGATTAGPVRYRVVRAEQATPTLPDQSDLVGETGEGELVDPAPPPGRALHYGVFAARTGQVWSEPAPLGPVMVTPEVDALEVVAAEDVVTGTWRLPAGAVGAVVRRGVARPPRLDDGQEVATTGVQFTDAGLRAGTTYHYRVSAAYRAAEGARHVSPGLVVAATPGLRAVTDLRVTVEGDARRPLARVDWPTPATGVVAVYRRATAPTHAAGDCLPLSRLGDLGDPLTASPERLGGGRTGLVTPAGHGRWSYTAVTLGGAEAVVGQTVTAGVAAPVTELTARRSGDVVVLGWVWPDRGHAARVRWWPTDGEPSAAKEVQYLRRTYDDGGGFRAEVGSDATTFEVRALVHEAGERLESAPAAVEAPGLLPRVRYRVRRSRWRGRVALEFTADRRCTVPDVLVVRSADRVMPRGPGGHPVVIHLSDLPLEPSVPHTIDLARLLPRTPGPTWLWCLLADEADPTVALVPPPADQLRAS